MSRSGTAVGLLCVIASLLWPARAAAGPVQYLAQVREVEATLTEEWLFPEDPTVLSHTESASATDFGLFDRSVTAVIPEPPPGKTSGFATMTHRSRLADDGVNISGHAEGVTGTDGGDFVVRSRLDVTFELDEPRDYAMSYRLEQFLFQDGLPEADIVLTRVGGAGGTVFDEDPVFDQNNGGNTFADGSRSGTLAAGRYRLAFVHGLKTDTSEEPEYMMSLALSPSGGPTPNPIPLPPALWPCAGTLLVAGVIRLRRHARPASLD